MKEYSGMDIYALVTKDAQNGLRIFIEKDEKKHNLCKHCKTREDKNCPHGYPEYSDEVVVICNKFEELEIEHD